MESLALNKNTNIYFDYEKKIIGRVPTPSNLKENGSDNSLYMGLKNNDKSAGLICNLFSINKIDDFSNRTFYMNYYDEFIELQTNINHDGQLQFKVVGNGKMHNMISKYEKIVKNKVNTDNIIIFLNFEDNEIYFSETTVENPFEREAKEKAKKEIDGIVKSAKIKEFENGDEVDAYIETTLNVRNNAIQTRFKRNLMIEFSGRCAICGLNKKELLRASHILPYRQCKTVEEMVDHNNGILLCPNHDDLFDKRFISFDEDTGKIIIVDKSILDEKLYDILRINKEVVLPRKIMTTKRKKYFSQHHVRKQVV